MPNFSGIWSNTQQFQAQATGNWPVPPVFAAIGAQANAATLQLQRSSVAQLSATSFVYAYIGYNTGSGVANIYAVVATLSGTTITFGSPTTLRSGLSPQTVYVCALSATSALVTYGDAGGIWAGTALSISGTTISAGSETANSGTVYGVTCVPLTSTTALTVANTTTGIKASVATVSGTSFSWGSTTASMSSANANYLTLSSGSSTTGVCAYIPFSGANSGKPCAVAMTISGTSVTPGSETVLDSSQSGTAWPPGISCVTSSSAIFAYGDSTTSYLKAVGMTISGTTITVGTPTGALTSYDAGAANSDAGNIITAISTSKALLVSRNAGQLVGQVLSISGTSVSSSATTTLYASSTRAPSVAYLGSNNAVIGYGDSTTYVSARVVTLT